MYHPRTCSQDYGRTVPSPFHKIVSLTPKGDRRLLKIFVRMMQVEGLEISTQEKVLPNSVTDASAVFENLNTKSVIKFNIFSTNEKGMSPRPSTIEVDEEMNRESTSASVQRAAIIFFLR